MTEPGSLNIVPNPTVPPPEEVVLKIDVGVYSKRRLLEERFKPTTTSVDTFSRTTNLQDYSSAVDSISIEVWNFVQDQRAEGAENTVHSAVWLDNPTHPITAAGVVRLPKGHHDSAFTDLEFSSVAVLRDHLKIVVADLKAKAKY